MSRDLSVYLHEHWAGTLSQDSSGKLSFSYAEEYLNSQSPRRLSVALPLQQAPFLDLTVRPFFSGLLPDDQMRVRLAQCLGVSKKNPQALLEAVGGECAGAVSLYLPGDKEKTAAADATQVLTEAQVIEILTLLKTKPLLAEEKEVRLSLAGAQEKLAVGLLDGKIALMKGNLPTSHILKPPIHNVEDSVFNECFCMKLAKMVKIPVPEVLVMQVLDVPLLLVERYDREKKEGKIKRLHQEDFCQASSIAPEMKYEREGGPSIENCFNLIGQHSTRPAADKKDLIRRVIFNYLIGNADAHGKNFSFIHSSRGQTLAPAYDLLCTSVYESLTAQMAMKIGSKYDPKALYWRHWECLQPNSAPAQRLLRKEAEDMAEKLPVLAKKLKESEKFSPIVDKIVALITTRAQLLLSRLP